MQARILSVLASLACCAAAAAQSTAFTYQGRLKNGAALASGLHDFRFRLYDAATGGTQLGTTQCSDNILVTEGLFVAALDFGQQFATASDRFLEIDVRVDTGLDCSSATGFTVLGPRQKFTAEPIALFARDANAAANSTQLNGQSASFYTSAANLTGTLAPTVLSGSFSSAVTLSNASNSFSGSGAGLTALDASNIATGTLANARTTGTFVNTPSTLVLRDPLGGFSAGSITSAGFSGPGVGLTNLNASNLSNGTVSDARLSTNIPRLDTANVFGNVTNTFMGKLAVGTLTPTHTVHIAASAPAIALQDTNSPTQQAGFVSYRDSGNIERAWVGYGTAGDPNFSIVNARTGGNIVLYPINGNVGVNTDTPLAKLHVNGSPTGTGVSASGKTGVSGTGLSSASVITFGVFGSDAGINGESSAVFANGRFTASGTKSFRIDHPADPENKYLLHYCSEAPEPQNFYNGIATLDERGEAVITLPSYFAAINKHPRYTLTALGAAMPMLHIGAKIDPAAMEAGAAVESGQTIPRCSFRIAGGVPGAEVSWEVKAVRNDRWVQKRGAPVEVEKSDVERGTYQHPDLYHQPDERATFPRTTSSAALIAHPVEERVFTGARP